MEKNITSRIQKKSLNDRLDPEKTGKDRIMKLMEMTVSEYFEGFPEELNRFLNLHVCKKNSITSDSPIYRLSENLINKGAMLKFIQNLPAKEKDELYELTFFPITHRGPVFKYFNMDIPSYLEYFSLYVDCDIIDEFEVKIVMGNDWRYTIEDIANFATYTYIDGHRDKICKCLANCVFESLHAYSDYLDFPDIQNDIEELTYCLEDPFDYFGDDLDDVWPFD